MKKGFTLIELLIVIGILAILATIAFLVVKASLRIARDTNRVALMHNIQESLGNYNIGSQGYPNSPNNFCGMVNALVQGNFLIQEPIDPLTKSSVCGSLTDGNISVGGATYIYVATPSSGLATSYLLKLVQESQDTVDLYSSK